jgi:hypothetical protein
MNNKTAVSFAQMCGIETKFVSSKNIGPPNTGIMGAHMVDTYLTKDGRTLVHEYGNGGGEWYFSDCSEALYIDPPFTDFAP